MFFIINITTQFPVGRYLIYLMDLGQSFNLSAEFKLRLRNIEEQFVWGVSPAHI